MCDQDDQDDQDVATSAEVRENWDAYRDKALVSPVSVTVDGEPSVVIISCDVYKWFHSATVQVIRPSDLTRADMNKMRAGIEAMRDDFEDEEEPVEAF